MSKTLDDALEWFQVEEVTEGFCGNSLQAEGACVPGNFMVTDGHNRVRGVFPDDKDACAFRLWLVNAELNTQ